jgi:DNA processing protein
VALAEIEGLGPAGARRLLDLHGSPGAVLSVARTGAALDRERPPGARALRRRVVSRLRAARPVPESRLDDLARTGIRLVRYGGAGYPEGLRDLHHPPVVLYVQGRLPLPSGRAVAVVGTRRATEYGRRVARDLAGHLAAAGVCIVSGMARGIDGAAHRAALDAGGPTAGIVAGGLDVEYPAAHRRLFAAMRERGVLASEFPPGTRPEAGLFPRRNRIIAALAGVTVVVQAGRPSGALITASHALELGREVGAVPGPVGPGASEGVHALLRDGAAVVTSAADVLELLDGVSPEPAAVGAGPPAAGPRALPAAVGALPDSDRAAAGRVWAAASEGPCAADSLAERSGLPHAAARRLLDRMELAGLLGALPGDRYERRRSW